MSTIPASAGCGGTQNLDSERLAQLLIMSRGVS